MATQALKPRVPVEPQPLDVLKARYPAAVRELIVQMDIVAGKRDAPSGEPAHVFDTEDGLRLIVSLERLPNSIVGTHISLSFHSIEASCRLAPTFHALVDLVRERWRALSGSALTPQFVANTSNVLHFWVERGH